jgi:NAD(P)-dependent dehydrogenase (short-subunit alcohol dehydrogenase family)
MRVATSLRLDETAGLDVDTFAHYVIAPAVPLGRVGTEDEVASAIIFLAPALRSSSPAAASVSTVVPSFGLVG